SQFATQFFGGFSLKIGNWRGCSRALSSILVVRKNKFEEKPQRIYYSVVNPVSIHPVCGLRSAVWRKKLLLFLTSSALLVLIYPKNYRRGIKGTTTKQKNEIQKKLHFRGSCIFLVCM
ncbi:unnamed protein product, partial [Ascophyllum nodosum]